MSKEKNYMITQDGCGHCESAKELLKDQIASGKIVDVPYNTKLGQELAAKHNIELTPTFINENNDGIRKKCVLSKEADKLFCEDNTEILFKEQPKKT